ncbi:SCAN domain-containing zinc finger protein [Microdochium nivale]|nr:SCAN domain-containing zinc finger protein [Microdochium nivale]
MSSAPAHGSDTDQHQQQHRHSCHCGRSFIRKEHLRRHQATHGERAHVCAVCGQSFTRNDLLRRHAARHEVEDLAVAGGIAPARKSRACDACRANKTRCTGEGSQCTLCTKRGVACTFHDDDTNLPAAHEELSSRPQAAPGDGLTSQTQALRHQAATSIPTSTAEAPLHVTLASLPPSLKQFLSSVLVESRPQQQVPTGAMDEEEPAVTVTQRGASPLRHSATLMDALYELLLSSASVRSSFLGRNMEASPGFAQWVTGCVDSYFEFFHPRWPILYAGPFDPARCSLPLVGIVAMVGCWFQNNPADRPAIWKVFNLMLEWPYDKLPTCPSSAMSQPWPNELFQGVLITIVFGIMWGDDDIISRSGHLCSLLISVCRGSGLFSHEELEKQKNVHHVGSWPPFVFVRDEQLKQLIMSIYLADNYFSILSGIPPTIDSEELCEPIVTTSALWNSQPIAMFLTRVDEEPPVRDTVGMCAVAGGDIGPMEWSLFEDARLALCGLQHTIWKHNQRRQRQRRAGLASDDMSSVVLRDATLKHLDMWAVKLNQLIGDCASQAAMVDAGEKDIFPLRAYRGGENQPDRERWKITPLQRAMAMGYECVLLYHMLSMRLCMHPALFAAGAGPWQPWGRMGGAMVGSFASDEGQLQEWARSDEGKRALWHAVATLKFVEQEAVSYGYPRGQEGHLEDAAVSTSVTVMGRWMDSNREQAACNVLTGNHHGVRVEDPWSQANSPARLMKEIEMCMCQFEQWLEHWLEQWHAKAPRALAPGTRDR